jgi:hypothetical protein
MKQQVNFIQMMILFATLAVLLKFAGELTNPQKGAAL